MKFEFQLLTEEGDIFWTQIQGSGGQIGNGCLHLDILKLSRMEQQTLLAKNLLRARRERLDEGALRIWKGDHLPPAERIVEVKVREVLDVRYVDVSGRMIENEVST